MCLNRFGWRQQDRGLVRVSSRRGPLLRDDKWRLGGALGAILGKASVLNMRAIFTKPANVRPSALALASCATLEVPTAPSAAEPNSGRLAADGYHNDLKNGARRRTREGELNV